jgi:CheY-like chemotaxis protein
MVLTQSENTAGSTCILRPARALVVDDEASTARLLEFVLQMRGYSVRTAADGPEALRAVCEFMPDVMLLDLQLPGMSGLSLLHQVRAIPGAERTVVVILTGRGFDEKSTEVLAAQAQAFRRKPVAPSTLIKTLESLGIPSRMEAVASGAENR